MKAYFVVALTAVLSAFCLSFAEDAPASHPASEDVKAPAQPDPDEMICLRNKVTGSNLLGPRICKPRKVWQKQHQDAQDQLNQQQRNGLLSQPAGG